MIVNRLVFALALKAFLHTNHGLRCSVPKSQVEKNLVEQTFLSVPLLSDRSDRNV